MRDVNKNPVINLSKFFDLSVVDQVEASLINGASDSFFLFSGPPQFINLTDLTSALTGDSSNLQEGGLCPLVFATGFNDADQRPPRGNLVSIGTQKTIAAPSTGAPMPRAIDITAGALVTSNPGGVGAGTTGEKWNFLKRLYYFLITNPNMSVLLGDGGGMYGNEAYMPNAPAPDYKSVWGNFGKSIIYDTPIGIMAIALSKAGEVLTVKYYQGCILQSPGPQLGATVNQAIMFSGSRGARLTYTDVVTFSLAESKNIVGGGDTSGADFMLALIASGILKT